MIPAAAILTQIASASPATTAMQSYVTPVVATFCVLASLACVFFLIWGGIQYTSSTGSPEKLEQAKRTIRNAIIGLVVVLAAACLTAILTHAYVSSTGGPMQKLPTIAEPPLSGNSGPLDAVLDMIIGVFRAVIKFVGSPFIKALSYFTNSTPLMGDNAAVFNLWLAVVGISDALFVLAIILLGFHIMSFSVFGFDEVDIKQLLPQLALMFLLMNTSIFLIDGIIALSNAMIHVLQIGFPNLSLWDSLDLVTNRSATTGFAGLLIMIAFIVVAVILLIYYLGRIIALYVGAILAPLVILLWLIPAFKDFAVTAIKVYLMLIFVLFVHAVIILLATSIFTGILLGDNNGQPNDLMAMLLGLATVLALLKTQDVMQQFSYAATAPRAIRELSGSFIRSASYTVQTLKFAKKAAKGTAKVAKRMSNNSQNGDGDNKGSGGKKPTSGSMTASKPLKTGEVRKAAPAEGAA